MKTILFLLLISFTLFAEDIYLKSGTIYFNAKIIERNESFITITVNEGKSNILLSDIEKIVETPYNPNIAGSVKQGKIIYNEPIKIQDPNTIKISQKPFLIVAALSGFLAWDYFSDVSDINKNIDKYKLTEELLNDAESQKTRKTIIGIVAAVGCAAALYFSFQEIEIKMKTNQVSLSYNF